MFLTSLLSKINFAIGRNPKVEKTWDFRKFIPEPYKSVLLITADFELAWAWRYSKNIFNPLESALEMARRERNNIPVILELCEEYDIPVTWLTVGHLFLEECERVNGGMGKRTERVAHPEIPGIKHFENEFWKYEKDDWFEYDPCSNFKEAPEWYCPDLIRLILDSKVKHEIGCHTFSHIDCRDSVCSPELFEAEISECKKAAEKFGLELKSFVHPGHTIGNLDKLAELGFTSYRTDYRKVLGYPKLYKNNLWEFEQTAQLYYRKEWSPDYHLKRYKKIIDRAIKSNTVCNLWFHPSVEEYFIENIMRKFFNYISRFKNELLVTTVTDYVNIINEK